MISSIISIEDSRKLKRYTYNMIFTFVLFVVVVRWRHVILFSSVCELGRIVA